MNEVRKCSKCGSQSITKKDMKCMGSLGWFNSFEATAYVCDKCGFIELYKRLKGGDKAE